MPMKRIFNRVGEWLLMATVFILLVLLYCAPYIILHLLIDFDLVNVWVVISSAAFFALYSKFKKE